MNVFKTTVFFGGLSFYKEDTITAENPETVYGLYAGDLNCKWKLEKRNLSLAHSNPMTVYMPMDTIFGSILNMQNILYAIILFVGLTM